MTLSSYLARKYRARLKQSCFASWRRSAAQCCAGREMVTRVVARRLLQSSCRPVFAEWARVSAQTIHQVRLMLRARRARLEVAMLSWIEWVDGVADEEELEEFALRWNRVHRSSWIRRWAWHAVEARTQRRLVAKAGRWRGRAATPWATRRGIARRTRA